VFATADSKKILRSHRGFDAGAATLARSLLKQASLGLIEGQMTRLLIDLNRTEQHPTLFSEWSKRLPDDARQELLDMHQEHTRRVEKCLRSAAARKRVHHLAIHSFTPVLFGKRRTTDIGLLYDPARSGESRWVDGLARELCARSDLCVHRNRPYRGTSDGLTTHLRGKLSDLRYAGVELEVNQRLLKSASQIRAMKRLLQQALRASLDE
jgi:predicted N-formylglutamate amidohydrolase